LINLIKKTAGLTPGRFFMRGLPYFETLAYHLIVTIAYFWNLLRFEHPGKTSPDSPHWITKQSYFRALFLGWLQRKLKRFCDGSDRIGFVDFERVIEKIPERQSIIGF